MILIIDNYDSFTYNLVQLVAQRSKDYVVSRNDKIKIDEIEKLNPEGVILSPGPGRPEHAGVCIELIKRISRYIPTLGVCLGHQAIGAAFGARITRAPVLMHGKTSEIHHSREKLFRNLPAPFVATRYHSLIVERESLPEALAITAETADGTIMGISHREYPINGIQFHPESILTASGPDLINNWMDSLTEQP